MTRTTFLASLALGLAATAGSGLQAQNLDKVITGIERHYNGLSGLRMQFEQSMQYSGRQHRVERGTLYMQRPGKMRWQYSHPADKIAISDGRIFRMYNPHTNQVRQMELEAMTDLRAPLSFLLGRMRLRRIFRNLRVEETDGRHVLIGEGRNARDYYSRVEFDFDPSAYSITGIRIVGRDESMNVYEFADEQANPTMAASLFDFRAPMGAEIMPLTRSFDSVPLTIDE